MKNLNKKELEVLNAIVESIKDCTGNEFTYGDDIAGYILRIEEYSKKKQVAGYLSQLSQKGYIEIAGDEYKGQITLTKKCLNVTEQDVSSFTMYK